jgi:hypothetical protein
MEAKPSTQDWTQSKTEGTKGQVESIYDKGKAAAYDLKAGVKEGLGYDANADRVEAERLRAEAGAKKTEHDAKSTFYDTKQNLERKVGH